MLQHLSVDGLNPTAEKKTEVRSTCFQHSWSKIMCQNQGRVSSQQEAPLLTHQGVCRPRRPRRRIVNITSVSWQTDQSWDSSPVTWQKSPGPGLTSQDAPVFPSMKWGNKANGGRSRVVLKIKRRGKARSTHCLACRNYHGKVK